MARIKLLRNKREIQVKQMRKEISQLLTSGQEPSARIRVEHIIREQNILAAYDILELFCELVAVLLPIIESQKSCPLDLKEAISSLIFASPRCADLPELLQIRQLFAAKYGKEFAAAAAELRPDCGVNRRIIEKLSVRAPSGEVKLKLMKEIAVEHDVDWDPTDSEAELLKSHEDLLDGPRHFLEANELLSSQLDSSRASDAASDVPIITMSQMPATLDEPSSSASLHDDERRHNVPFRNIPPPTMYEVSAAVKSSPPSHTPIPTRKVGTVPRRDASSDGDTDNYVPKPRGEYSDAASAAQAAQELATRALAAARAATDLARKQSGHYSSKVQPEKSDLNPLAERSGQYSSKVQPEKSDVNPPEEEESATDLDSSGDEGEANLPVRGQHIPATRYSAAPAPAPAPAKFSDSDSDTAEYDVPRGRGPGGSKQARSRSAVKRLQKPPSQATKLDYQKADTANKPSLDSDDDGEGSVLFRAGKQELNDESNSRKGGGLKWISKDDRVPRDESGEYETSDANRDETKLRYGFFNHDSSRPDDPYSAYDQYKHQSSKLSTGSREGSPLFDDEGSVGKHRKPSRLGSSPGAAHFDDEDSHHSSLFSGTRKYGADDVSYHRDPSPKAFDEDDLDSRLEALKLPWSR